ncbi:MULTISPECIES: BatD family protein [unclassified Ruegeria]|uniref:BatD family protein n=1 Tax=unclassified Ruegeria TaxID=2625375 RepID=UPI0014920505|nr:MULTISPECIES: BatD family protein [unclassified Ruegeria]NOC45691.1 hypothetical protein [Ruegeria sp. HKCCD7559]
MKWLFLLLIALPMQVLAQSKTVLPSEALIEVAIEDNAPVPFTQEMVLLTIRGVYRRHITREELIQPRLDGFSWAQLGPDSWSEQRINGRKYKVFTRRMAIYPVEAGKLTIGPFVHRLTLTDENDDWFEHEIQSEPLTIQVAQAPATKEWWFPVRKLQISDQWSNAPDQLAPGEGVLRVIRLEALGATPEMIPPMPELTSPSALIFPHPEKRLVELTPEGPVTHAFWRWTIRPSNDTSGIVEPLQFSYFDTVARETREVVISPQRIAYGTAIEDVNLGGAEADAPAATLLGWPMAATAIVVFLAGLGFGMSGHKLAVSRALRRFGVFDPLARELRRSARAGRADRLRQAASAVLRRDGPSSSRLKHMQDFDRQYFDPNAAAPDLKAFARVFLGNQTG